MGYNEVMRIRLIVLGLLLIVIVVAMSVTAPRKYPFKLSSAQHLWLWATTIPSPGAVQWWELDVVRDGYVYYHIQQYHGWELFRTPLTDIQEHLDVIVHELESDDGSVERPPWVRPAFEAWRSSGGEAVDLLNTIKDQRESFMVARSTSAADILRLSATHRRYFEFIHSRAKQYGWNIAFESVFLFMFAVFVIWPWLRRRSAWSQAYHLAAAPFLFFLPYYCGYGIWAYTSYYGDGGIIYTWLLRWFRWESSGAIHSLEQFFDVELPDPQAICDILVPLNQLYSRDMGLYAYGGPPPLVTLSLLLVLFVFITLTRIVLSSPPMVRRRSRSESKDRC